MPSGFMSTMHFLYHKSDAPLPVVAAQDRNFFPFMAVVVISLLGYFGMESLTLENLIAKFLG
jgi:hypothetical protein